MNTFEIRLYEIKSKQTYQPTNEYITCKCSHANGRTWCTYNQAIYSDTHSIDCVIIIRKTHNQLTKLTIVRTNELGPN